MTKQPDSAWSPTLGPSRVRVLPEPQLGREDLAGWICQEIHQEIHGKSMGNPWEIHRKWVVTLVNYEML